MATKASAPMSAAAANGRPLGRLYAELDGLKDDVGSLFSDYENDAPVTDLADTVFEIARQADRIYAALGAINEGLNQL